MMSENCPTPRLTILKDSLTFSSFFYWNGQLDERFLLQWLENTNINLPSDLICLWQTTGGGDFFECETILSPIGNIDHGDEILSTNQFFQQKGLPVEFFLFHTGTFDSAIKLSSQTYVIINESYRIEREFKNLEDWYINAIRPLGKSYKSFI